MGACTLYKCCGNDIVFFIIVLDLVDCTVKLFLFLNALFCFGAYVCYIAFSVKRF